jgi:tRNA/tmRNA/rRNA uracil-C5-methylase (TrmA/RlmC/RlmD family)
MKFGHKLQVKIDGYDKKGRGTAKAEIAPGMERDISVPHSAKGDELEVVFIKRDHAVKICELEKILKAGADRIEAECEHAGKCGGCIWQHLRYEAQLEEKMRGVRQLFRKIDLEDKVLDVIPAEETLHYRNRMDYAVGWNGEIGLKETGCWNRYVDIKECHLLQPGAGEILQIVREWMLKHDLQPWDVKFHGGDVRYVVIRDGVNTKERMVIVVVADARRLTTEMKEDLVKSISPNPSLSRGADSISPNPSLSRGASENYPVYVPYEVENSALAKKMRKHPTIAEKKLWDELLKGDKMEGLRFLRQKPLQHFIADFYCSSLGLVIEVDGESHAKTLDYDKYRTEEIEKYNIKVIRFHNDEVMNAIEQVEVKLKSEIKKRKIELENSSSLIKEGFGVDCEYCATSLLIGEQSKPADLSYAQSFETLIGKPSITEIVNDVTYEIHPNSFFQTNTKMAARLQDVVLDALRDAGTKKLLDLYCGLGFFGIAAAKKIGELEQVTGYELDEDAIKLASQNMNMNGVGDRCRFFSGPAEALEWKEVEADTIILDPPRSGLHHKVIKTLLAEDSPSYPQTIIYVSCNYHKLEHELPSFMEKYDVVSIQPLDLFPQTRHIETVVTLKLKAQS